MPHLPSTNTAGAAPASRRVRHSHRRHALLCRPTAPDTPRNLRRYLSTWVDWKSSKLGEGLNDFRTRALKEEEAERERLDGSPLPWTLHGNPKWGLIRDVRRNSGTVQKDWAVVKSNTLPDHFCIAVVGHQGWSLDPDSTARYALAVTLDIVGEEIAIYEPLRIAAIELQAEVDEAEADTDVETEAEVEVSDWRADIADPPR